MTEFADYVVEVLGQFGEVRARRMFGGFGLFRDSLMFALVAEDTLYFKADGQSAPLFESRGLEQFEYQKRNKTVKLSYFMAPEEIFDDPDEARVWSNHAFDAALRASSKNQR